MFVPRHNQVHSMTYYSFPDLLLTERVKQTWADWGFCYWFSVAQ
jgi:hypothetical protein